MVATGRGGRERRDGVGEGGRRRRANREGEKTVTAEEGMVRKEYIEEGVERDVNEEGGVMKRNGVGVCKLGGGALGLGTSEPGARFGCCLGVTEGFGSVSRSSSFGGGCTTALAAVRLWSVTEISGRIEVVGNTTGLVTGYNSVSRSD